jgi:hypothetical protein
VPEGRELRCSLSCRSPGASLRQEDLTHSDSLSGVGWEGQEMCVAPRWRSREGARKAPRTCFDVGAESIT